MNKELLEALINFCDALDDIAYRAEFTGYKDFRKAAQKLREVAEKYMELSDIEQI